MPDNPWSRIGANLFLADAPAIYSLTIHCEPPNSMRSDLRARRTFAEGLLNALADQNGRRPSMAENVQDSAMDAAESRAALGKPIFRTLLLSALFAERSQLEAAIAVRRAS